MVHPPRSKKAKKASVQEAHAEAETTQPDNAGDVDAASDGTLKAGKAPKSTTGAGGTSKSMAEAAATPTSKSGSKLKAVAKKNKNDKPVGSEPAALCSEPVVSTGQVDSTGASPTNRDGAAEGQGGLGDIDSIFADAKSKKTKADKQETQDDTCRDEGANEKGSKKPTPRKSSSSSLEQLRQAKRKAAKEAVGPTSTGTLAQSSRARTRTEEGYTVYREEELQWNKKKAGGTKLCPFDCDCCF